MSKGLLVNRFRAVFCLDGGTHHPPVFRPTAVHLAGLHAMTRLHQRYQQSPPQERSGEFEPATVERVEPVHDGIFARRFVCLVAHLPHRGLIDGGEDDDRPNIAGIEGLVHCQP
jgi:hypothetical protein